jgi:hypothetical protein
MPVRSVDDERAACWRRFTEAAAAARLGDFDPARALVERVRAKSGNFAAAVARLELRAWIKHERVELERTLATANRSIAPVLEIGSHSEERDDDQDRAE